MNEPENPSGGAGDGGAPSPAPPQPPTEAPASAAPAGAASAGDGSAAAGAGGPGAPESGAPESGAGPASAGGSRGGDQGEDEGGDQDGSGRRRRRRRRRRKSDAGGDGTSEGVADGDDAGGNAAPPGPPKGPRRERGPRRGRGGGQGPGFGHGHGHGHGPGRGHPHGGGGRDTAHLATQAVRALAAMAQQLLRVEGVDPLAMPRYLDLALRVPLDGGKDNKDTRQAAGTAVDQILKRVREVREHERALRPGAVFSYFAGSSEAEGCRPTEPRHVFEGYGSTGKPQFVDFVTLAIDRKDAGIDRLLAGEEVILTQVSMGRVLRTQQLAEFGGESPVYKILGQVNAGLFKVLGAAGKCAFSFQLLRGTTLEGRVRLRLHPVGAVDLMDLVDPAIIQILSRFQRRLDAEALRLEGSLKNGATDEEEFVLPLLNELSKQLQSRARNAGRRTQHGLERSEEGQRPTSRAYPDAGEASDGDILWDVDQGTIVVLGAKNRVHVFTPDGKHVTSVVMQRTAVDRRRQLGRWREADPEERGEFRIQVRRHAAEEAQPSEPQPSEPRPGELPPRPSAPKPASAPAPEPSAVEAPAEAPVAEAPPAVEPSADEPPAGEPPVGESSEPPPENAP